MSSKRGKLAERRVNVGQSSTPITVETSHLERVPATVLDTPEDVVAFWIPVGDVRPSPFQYRYHVDEARLQGLAQSIASQELYQPITVRPVQTGTYEVVLGHRRLEAFKRLGRDAIPAIIREYDDAQAVRALLDENLKRADVNLFEQTEGVIRLLSLELSLQGEGVSTVRRLMEEMRGIKRSGQDLKDPQHLKAGKIVEEVTGMSWESFLINRLSVYRLSSALQEKVRQGMPYSLAVAVGRLDPALQAKALAFVQLADGWRSREEFKIWLQKQKSKTQVPPQVDHARFKKVLRRLEQKEFEPTQAARIAAMLDELEELSK
ncbi:ParB/RepB/Spo0J family partition protein [Deinococcus hopiensis]|uniref:ParB-like nuclease domain-containing protein n=1 Tax=Deinococcus hopiensis KR-140 TaxID=695939 RepID=A0A1W1UYZ3_9DEIO|nr:ParB/RepB/Spo0J family partition protein [Deinococcus hopiensis]SMB86342.1 ParB-like nuclease domain-containing protein [Deinococcus hopiensis KR-140]